MYKPLQDADGERAVERYLVAEGWSYERARKVMVSRPWDPDFKPFSTAHDFFGCLDFIAFHPDHGFWLVQVTCQDRHGGGGKVAERRRKIGKLRLPVHVMRQPKSLRVSVLETRVRVDPANSRRRQDYALVHDLFGNSGWAVTGEVVLPRKPPSPSKPRARPPTPQADLFDPNDPDMPPM